MRSLLRLTTTAARAVDIPGGVAAIIGRELHVDAGKFGGLAGPAQRILFAEVNQVLLGRTA
jgi:hypothetical protein